LSEKNLTQKEISVGNNYKQRVPEIHINNIGLVVEFRRHLLVSQL